VALIDVTIEVPVGQSRSVQLRIVDLEGGAQAGDQLECLLLTEVAQLPFFVQLIEPASEPALGSFQVNATLTPEGTQSESVNFLFDVEPNLKLNLTLSGLTLGMDVGFGITGMEFAILKLHGFLGAIDLDDEFVFAAAFDNKNQVLAGGQVGFVKKRIRTRANVVGLIIDNLAIFENTKFKHPFSSDTQALGALQTPSFHFGDLLTFSGTTPIGVPVRLVFGLCADPARPNIIKKRVFFASVCDMDWLHFNVAQMRLGPIQLDALSLSSALEFRPNSPLQGSVTVRTRLLDALNVLGRATFDENDLKVQFALLSLSAPEQFVSVRFDKTLNLSSVSMRLNTTIMASTRIGFQLSATPNALRSASITLNQPLTAGSFSATSRFSPSATGVGFQSTRLTWMQSIGPLQTTTGLTLSTQGLQQIQASARWGF